MKDYYTFDIQDENGVYMKYKDYAEQVRFAALEHAEMLRQQYFVTGIIDTQEKYEGYMTQLMTKYVKNEEHPRKKFYSELVFRILDYLVQQEYKDI